MSSSSDTLLLVGVGAAALFVLNPSAFSRAVDAASGAVEKAAEAATKALDINNQVIDIAKLVIDETAKAIQESVNVGIGVPLVFEPCREGFRNDGFTCFKDGGLRTYECGRLRGAFGEDWGPKYCTDTWAPEAYSRKLVCGKGRENVDSLCYAKCPPGKNRVPGMPYLCR